MRWLPGVLAVAGVALLLAVPVTFTEANGEGQCPSLASGSDDFKQAESYSVGRFILTGQRQNATCDDARYLRAIYVILGVLVTVVTWARLARPLPSWLVWTARAFVAILAVAAVLDGPLVPTALVVIGGSLAFASESMARA
jgi:hypothetical protein